MSPLSSFRWVCFCWWRGLFVAIHFLFPLQFWLHADWASARSGCEGCPSARRPSFVGAGFCAAEPMLRCRVLAVLRFCSKGLSVCWPDRPVAGAALRRSHCAAADAAVVLLCSRNQAAARGVLRRVAVRRAARPLAFSWVAVGRRARWRVRCQRYVRSASVVSAPL